MNDLAASEYQDLTYPELIMLQTRDYVCYKQEIV